jgi:hypothetical protein
MLNSSLRCSVPERLAVLVGEGSADPPTDNDRQGLRQQLGYEVQGIEAKQGGIAAEEQAVGRNGFVAG